MRGYISIQKAIEKINERARKTFSLGLAYAVYLGALQDVENDLRQLPTIDAVPVKHGEWKWHGSFSFYQCSKCSEISERRTNYCPNCGADMRERKDNE